MLTLYGSSSACLAYDGKPVAFHVLDKLDSSARPCDRNRSVLPLQGNIWCTTLRKSEGSTLAAKFGGNWTLQDEELVDGGVFFVSGCKEFLYREIPDNECPHVLVPVSLLRWTHSDIEQHLYFRHAMLIMRRRFIDVRRCTRVAGALRALEGNCWWPPRENALQFPPRLTRDRHCGIQRCTRM